MRVSFFGAFTALALIATPAMAADLYTLDTSTTGTPFSETVPGRNTPDAATVSLFSDPSNLEVQYSSSSTLHVGNNGLGPVSAASTGLSYLTLTLNSATQGFSAIKFNIDPTGNGSGTVFGDITIDPANDDPNVTFSNVAFDVSGNNRFSITALPTALFRSITFSNLHTSGGVATTFDSIRQVSFNAAAVPEATTWAMMIVGFGAIGAAMRRRKHAGIDGALLAA